MRAGDGSRPPWLSERLYPFESRYLGEALFPDHRTVMLQGAGHYIQEDAPEEIVAAIREWRG
jgi:pimeloyl-ACP methyl ester carboxylesterase